MSVVLPAGQRLARSTTRAAKAIERHAVAMRRPGAGSRVISRIQFYPDRYDADAHLSMAGRSVENVGHEPTPNAPSRPREARSSC